MISEKDLWCLKQQVTLTSDADLLPLTGPPHSASSPVGVDGDAGNAAPQADAEAPRQLEEPSKAAAVHAQALCELDPDHDAGGAAAPVSTGPGANVAGDAEEANHCRGA